MTLHEAIEKVLNQSGQSMTTQQIADELNKNGWYKKGDGSIITAFQIHGRTKNHPNLFSRNGINVSLIGQSVSKQLKVSTKPSAKIKQPSISSDKDENYVLDLCDKVLKMSSSRQHKFDFLLGDPNSKGVSARLPVDSYYEKLELVIEYREKQHTESVSFFDKPNRMTVSGVHRGEQRTLYDERRRQVLPKNNINLVEISYSDFIHDSKKRIIRNPELDEKIIIQKLYSFVNCQ
nr:HTH domain-containing protein [uncultured Flavobacterium sp.]